MIPSFGRSSWLLNSLDLEDEEAVILHSVRKYLPSETSSVFKELIIGRHGKATH
jgi:hypothetical protein